MSHLVGVVFDCVLLTNVLISVYTHFHAYTTQIKHTHTTSLPPTHTLISVAAKQKEKMAEAGITDGEGEGYKSSQESSAEDDRLQRHLDSASTLNHGSSSCGTSVAQSYELQPTEQVDAVPSGTSLSVTVVGSAAGSQQEGNSQEVRGVVAYSSN